VCVCECVFVCVFVYLCLNVCVFVHANKHTAAPHILLSTRHFWREFTPRVWILYAVMILLLPMRC
jgi:hypothetical protein